MEFIFIHRCGTGHQPLQRELESTCVGVWAPEAVGVCGGGGVVKLCAVLTVVRYALDRAPQAQSSGSWGPVKGQLVPSRYYASPSPSVSWPATGHAAVPNTALIGEKGSSDHCAGVWMS